MATQKSYSADEATARLQSLPSEIRNYIYGPNMDSALADIGKKYSLHVDQMGALEGEVVGALLGFTEPQDFAGMIEERAGVNAVVAAAIVQDINAMLFEKIRESLKQMTGGGKAASSPVVQKPPAAAAKPAAAVAKAPATMRPLAAVLPASTPPQVPTPAATPVQSPAQKPVSVPVSKSPGISKYSSMPTATAAPVIPPKIALPPTPIAATAPAIPRIPTPAPAPIQTPAAKPVAAPTPIAKEAAPPQNLPTVPRELQSSEIPLLRSTGSVAQTIDAAISPPVAQPPAASVKKYTADPYRETPE